MNPSLNASGATEQPKVVLRAMEPEDLEWLYAMENDLLEKRYENCVRRPIRKVLFWHRRRNGM